MDEGKPDREEMETPGVWARGWPRTRRGVAVLQGMLLFSFTVLLYSTVWGHHFVDFDDTSYITNNPAVSSGLNPASIRWAFTSFHDGYWLPVTWISYMAVESASPHNAGLQAMVNVVFHGMNAVLLAQVLIVLTGQRNPSYLVAWLFAIHPQHVESVAWIAERKDVLFMFFGLLSIWGYVNWVRAEKGRGRGWMAGALVCYALSLMAKPMLVTLPVILLLIDFWPLERVEKWGPRLLEKFPFFLLALISAGISFAGKQASGAAQSARAFPIWIRGVNALVSYVKYVGQTIYPAGLATPYPYPRAFDTGAVIGAFVLLVGITALVFCFGKSRRYLIVGWCWFVISLLPVIGLVQVGAQPMADRFMYFPAIGLYVILWWWIHELGVTKTERPTMGHVGICLVLTPWLLFILATTIGQIDVWQDSGTLFGRAAAVTKDNDLAEQNVGLYMAQQGDVGGALGHFLKATQISPNFATAHHNAGMAYEALGKPGDALKEYELAVHYDPTMVESYFNAGNVFLKMGNKEKAARLYRRALEVKPGYGPAKEALAGMYEGAALER